uniref:hypothetical protein n=1 Tax=Streptomyces virginiae TaxID=1961 RepID=UPI002F90D784
MPEYVIAAGVTVGGYLVAVVGTWLRARGQVQLEKARGSLHLDVVRELPPGSRFVDSANRVTIQIGRPASEAEGGGNGLGH